MSGLTLILTLTRSILAGARRPRSAGVVDGLAQLVPGPGQQAGDQRDRDQGLAGLHAAQAEAAAATRSRRRAHSAAAGLVRDVMHSVSAQARDATGHQVIVQLGTIHAEANSLGCCMQHNTDMSQG